MPSEYTITRLSTTPVKGLALHHPDSIDLTLRGAAGDRQFYLIDDSGQLQSCTKNPGLYGLLARWDEPNRRLEISHAGDLLIAGTIEPASSVETDMWGHRMLTADVVADPAWSSFFSDAVGQRVRLVQARESAFDVHPATLLGMASVQELARQAEVESVDASRFRMLIEFSGGEPHIEDSWTDARLETGGAVLRAGGPVKRCAATTRNPGSGAVDLQTLKLITGYRGRQDAGSGVGAYFGIYATVLQPGTISVGDVLNVRS